MVKIHFSNYQKRDFEVVDYQVYELPGTNLRFRGPQHEFLTPGGYIVCIGAAQTFGCLCEEPYPRLLSKLTGLPVLNLGYGGAGPAFFTKHQKLHHYIANARLAVIQVMSARSVSNKVFDSGGLEYLTVRRTKRRIGAEQAWKELLVTKGSLSHLNLPWPLSSLSIRVDRFFSLLKNQKLVEETRKNWITEYCELFDWIKIPKILFWFSRRAPHYSEDYKDIWSLFGEFPQLVNHGMVELVAKHAQNYVQCISSEGTPHVLRSRFTGEPVAIDPANDRPDLGGHVITQDSYYPSPEMHRAAANALAPFCI